jgi:hypothetical protein
MYKEVLVDNFMHTYVHIISTMVRAYHVYAYSIYGRIGSYIGYIVSTPPTLLLKAHTQKMVTFIVFDFS